MISRYIEHWKRTGQKHHWPDQPWYSGIGLHHNWSCDIKPLTKQLCGNDGRSDYHDTLAYDQEIFPGLLDHLGPFTLVRGKITCLNGQDPRAQDKPRGSWHRDESPFEVLRVVVPLSSDPTYLFQLDNTAPLSLLPGHAYAFDQGIYHRVYSSGPASNERLHLVLSFVTWFDRTKNGWEPNDYFNRVHPLDLFSLVCL